MTTASDVAAWMNEQIRTKGELYQDHAFHDIDQLFGADFAYVSERGSLVIDPAVLRAFNKLTPDVVWSRTYRYWRLREPGDEPGRMQP